MNDFLRNIFSRGSFARTDSPVVVVGGISSNSATLTVDVLHFDSTGNLLVNTAVGGSGGSSQISGSVTAIVTAGTMTVQALLAGTVTVQALLAGTVSALWPQRLDASNDAILSYGSARTNDISGLMAASGSNIPMICDSLGKQVVLPGSVGDMNVRGSFQGAGVLAQTLISTPGAGRRIAVQFLGITLSASEAMNIIISGGPTNLTFGPFVPTGGIAANAGGAPLYITSASTNLSVAGSTTASYGIVATGYQMSN